MIRRNTATFYCPDGNSWAKMSKKREKRAARKWSLSKDKPIGEHFTEKKARYNALQPHAAPEMARSVTGTEL